jgi:hypothetical protein
MTGAAKDLGYCLTGLAGVRRFLYIPPPPAR